MKTSVNTLGPRANNVFAQTALPVRRGRGGTAPAR
jgi:hypothetical protein